MDHGARGKFKKVFHEKDTKDIEILLGKSQWFSKTIPSVKHGRT